MDLTAIFQEPAILWFIIGLVFILLEFIMPGFIIVFFGVGAWVTSLVCLVFDINLTAQLFLFIIISVLSLQIFRKYLKTRFFSDNEKIGDILEDEFIGKTAIVEVPIKAGFEGRVMFKGAQWTATSEADIKKGAKVKIIDKESITLKVEPIK
ncbi:MAG: NfeD family protein [Calditrichaceae bacterium]|nr:NfeD family protein [Calditrichaceae bacterium]MBN2709548.1 NfeD family protein [Calditrichaceae bacterium]RQV96809.1 MAG: NfeD family protein [Calditrichota bacterium]